MGKKSTWRTNISTGYRAPNSSELFSDGVHHGSFRYEKGSTTLTTEKATQIDMTFAFHFDDLEVFVNPFYNRINDYIFLEKQDSVIDGFQLYQYRQLDFAQLYGSDFGFHYHPHIAHWLHLENSFSTVFAEDENKNPLSLIPQTRLNTQLKFDFSMKGKFKLANLVVQHIYYFKQNRLGQFESETSNFHLLNIGLNARVDFNQPLIISLGLRNILNTTYLNHLSSIKDLGIPNAGMNAYLSIKWQFEKKKIDKN